MIRSKSSKTRNAQSKGLLVIVLLFSIFSLTAGNLFQAQPKQVTATEQVVTANRTAKRIHAFKKASVTLPYGKAPSLLSQQIAVAILLQEKENEVKVKAISRGALSIKSLAEHCSSAYIPQSSNEDNFNSFRG